LPDHSNACTPVGKEVVEVFCRMVTLTERTASKR
jgi:hypothetical protein